MPSAIPQLAVNGLLARLPRQSRLRVLASCDPIDLAFGTILCQPGQPVLHTYFPLTAWISLMATVSRHPPLEMGLIGSEGMLGATLVLGVNATPLQAVVQGSGTALRLSAAQLRLELARSPALIRTMHRYLYVVMAQLAQTLACTRFHELDARLVRWLLMTHDRAHADQFHLTHQFLADMLGVQRSAVTIAAGDLQRRKLISYSRGAITILNRQGLESCSCECYAAVVHDYEQLLG